MSDNELDNLFKEAAADFESPQQDTKAWERMAARLDQQSQPSGFLKNWKGISLFVIAGLLVTSGVWYAVLPDERNNTIAGNVINVASEDIEQNSTLQTADEIGTNRASLKENTVAKHNANKESDKGVSGSPATDKQRESIRKIFNQAEYQQIPRQDKVLVQPDIKTNTHEAYATERVEADLKHSSHADNQPFNNPHKLPQTDTSGVIKRDSVITNTILSDSLVSAEEPETKNKNKAKGRSGFILKLAVSPDFSSINFSSSGKSGINYGALVGYTFNNRWSVFTGIISSKKLYSSTEIESSYSSGGHAYPVEKLDGDCRILDIPVNVYYNFFPESSWSLKAGVGFSSYLMLSETYVYCVDYYGTDTYYEQKIKGENNEWFKVLNLSIAAEKRLTNRLSAEVEPFVKVPLSGIGEGKISLVSLGAFVNVKFNLFKNP